MSVISILEHELTCLRAAKMRRTLIISSILIQSNPSDDQVDLVKNRLITNFLTINMLITRMSQSLVFQLPDNMTGTLICINT